MTFTVMRFGVWNSNNHLYTRESVRIPHSGPIFAEPDWKTLSSPIGEFFDAFLQEDRVVCQIEVKDRLHRLILRDLPMYPVSAGLGEVSRNGVVKNFQLTHMLLTDKPTVWIDEQTV